MNYTSFHQDIHSCIDLALPLFVLPLLVLVLLRSQRQHGVRWMQLRNENPIHYSLMQTLPYQQTLLAKAETLESHMFPRHVLNPGRNSYNFIFKDKLTSSWDLECLAELLKEGNKSANYVSILPALNPKPNTQTKPQDRKNPLSVQAACYHSCSQPPIGGRVHALAGKSAFLPTPATAISSF